MYDLNHVTGTRISGLVIQSSVVNYGSRGKIREKNC